MLLRDSVAHSRSACVPATTVSASNIQAAVPPHGSMMMFLFGFFVGRCSRPSPLVRRSPWGRGTPVSHSFRLRLLSFLRRRIRGRSIFFDARARRRLFMYPRTRPHFDVGYRSDIWMLGFSFIEVSSIAAAIADRWRLSAPARMRLNLIRCRVYIRSCRSFPVRLPPLCRRCVVRLERLFDCHFRAARGVDPLRWQHLF